MPELLLDPQLWLAFATLTALELVLGIDNIIFIAILVERLAPARRETARRLGLLLALFMRIALLVGLSWVVGLTEPLFTLGGVGYSGRMLILAGGGLFLLWKSGGEIRTLLAGEPERPATATGGGPRFSTAIVQIMLIDLVFSLDSIITAVGMVDQVPVMIAAVVVSVLLMMAFAGGIGRFVAKHPTIKMLALAFLLVVGAVLVVEGAGYAVPKGYVYSALAFALLVELANLRLRHNARGRLAG